MRLTRYIGFVAFLFGVIVFASEALASDVAARAVGVEGVVTVTREGNSIPLTTGAFRLISGSIAKLGPDLMKLDTPVATVGIRGTSLVGKAGKVGTDNHIILVADPNGNVGEVVVENSSGVVTLSKKGEGVKLQNPTEQVKKAEYKTEFIDELAKQVPVIKYESIQDRQFRSLFWFND